MADIYAADDTLSRRAQLNVIVESLLCMLPLLLRDFEEVMNLHARDLEDTLHVFNVTCYLRPIQMLESADLLSGQYHGQCPHHSAADCTHHMIQSGSVFFVRLNFIEIFDSTVNTIVNRLTKALDNSLPGGSSLSGNGNS
jgi:hypothetical protein